MFPDEGVVDLTTADIFPDIGQPDIIGTSSGDIIGSQPIFGAVAGRFPFGILNARKNALKVAASEKIKAEVAAQKEANKLFELGEVKVQYRKEFDDNFTDLTNKFYNDAIKDYGSASIVVEALKTKGHPLEKKYKALTRDINYARDSIEYFVDESKAIMEKAVKGDVFIPLDYYSIMEQIQNGEYPIEDLVFGGAGSAGNNLRKIFTEYKAFDKVVGAAWISDIQPVIDKKITEYQVKGSPGITSLHQIYSELVADGTVDKAVDIAIKNGYPVGLPKGLTKQDIKDVIVARMNNKKYNEQTLQGTLKESSGSGAKQKYVPSEKKQVTFNRDAGKYSLNVEKWWTLAGKGNAIKDVPVLPTKIYIPGDSNRKITTGITDAINLDVYSVGEFTVDGNGTLQDVYGDEIKKKGYHTEYLAVGNKKTSTTVYGTTTTTEETHYVPYADVRQALINSGVPLPDFEKPSEGEQEDLY